jgi:hypothetical protein
MKNNFYPTRMRFQHLFLFGLLLLSGFAKAQLAANGGFEDWTGTCPTNTPPDAWTNYSTALGPDEAGCAGTVTSHSGSAHMNLVWINSGLQEGASQIVSGLTMGTTYRISFWAINDNGLYADPGDCILEVHRNTVPTFSTPNLVAGGAWTYYSVDFVASAPFETIALRVTPGTGGTSGSVGVDDFAVEIPVGIHDGMQQAFSIYPNPANGDVYVRQAESLTNNLGQVGYTISNVLGQQVHQSVADFTTGDAKLNLPTLLPGVYYLKMTIDGENLVQKFIMN